MSAFSGWENFYVIVGGAAGALTGLTFVALSLVAEIRLRGASRGIPAFTTPTIVHFGVALFVCALLSAPWPELIQPAVVLGLCGLGGAIYTLIVTRRVGSVNTYAPVLEDWLGHSISPLASYLALLGAGVALPASPTPALFVVAIALLLLIFTGIHNAWDGVTYLIVERVLPKDEIDDGDEKKE